MSDGGPEGKDGDGTKEDGENDTSCLVWYVTVGADAGVTEIIR